MQQLLVDLNPHTRGPAFDKQNPYRSLSGRYLNGAPAHCGSRPAESRVFLWRNHRVSLILADFFRRRVQRQGLDIRIKPELPDMADKAVFSFWQFLLPLPFADMPIGAVIAHKLAKSFDEQRHPVVGVTAAVLVPRALMKLF